MALGPRRSPSDVLRVVRPSRRPMQTRRIIHLPGVGCGELALRAAGLRAALRRIAVLASRAPRLRAIRDKARGATEDPPAGAEALRSTPEGVVRLAARGRAPVIRALARDELGAAYSVAGRPRGEPGP